MTRPIAVDSQEALGHSVWARMTTVAVLVAQAAIATAVVHAFMQTSAVNASAVSASPTNVLHASAFLGLRGLK